MECRGHGGLGRQFSSVPTGTGSVPWDEFQEDASIYASDPGVPGFARGHGRGPARPAWASGPKSSPVTGRRRWGAGPVTEHLGGSHSPCCSVAAQDVISLGRDPVRRAQSFPVGHRWHLGSNPLGLGAVSCPLEPCKSASLHTGGLVSTHVSIHPVSASLRPGVGSQSLCNQEHTRRYLFLCMWSIRKPTFLLTKTMGLEINQPL